MLRAPENEFERRLLWRSAIKPTTLKPPRVEPKTVNSKTIQPPRVCPTNVSPSMPNPRTITKQPVEPSLEVRLEQAVAIKQQLDEARRSGRLWLNPHFRRACSAGQLLFQVVGVAGYAGYFVSMHTLMRVFSGALMAGAWYAIYRIKGVTQP
jgi:hypothetical protein